MIDDNRYSNMTEAEINEIAKKYSDAKKAGDKNEKKYYGTELCKIVMEDSILNRKLKSKINSDLFNNKKDEIILNCCEFALEYYSYDANNNFVSAMLKNYLKWIISKENKAWGIRKIETENNEKETVRNISLEQMITDENGDIDYFQMDEIGAEEPFDEEEEIMDRRSDITSLITQFFNHLSSKSSTQEKYIYFRIFFYRGNCI